jgi:colicin import membrane protein
MFGRMFLGLALCLAAAGEGEGGGAGGVPPAPPPPGPSAAELEKARAEAKEAARKEARAEFLKEQGFDSEDAYKTHLDEKKKAEDAKLSENERVKKLYNEVLDARGKAEAKLEAERAARKAAEEALALRDRLDAQGVLPSERKFVEVALEEAEAAAKKAGKAFDEKAFFEELRKTRSYFFSKEDAQFANTSTSAGAGAKGNPTTNGNLTFDASQLSDAEWSKWRATNKV